MAASADTPGDTPRIFTKQTCRCREICEDHDKTRCVHRGMRQCMECGRMHERICIQDSTGICYGCRPGMRLTPFLVVKRPWGVDER